MPKIYYDNKNFFGIYLDIYNDRIDNYMFFPNLSFINNNENNNEDNKFFGTFHKRGNKLILNIPNSNRIEEVKKNFNNNKKDEEVNTDMKDIEWNFLKNNNDISENENNSMDICDNNNMNINDINNNNNELFIWMFSSNIRRKFIKFFKYFPYLSLNK